MLRIFLFGLMVLFAAITGIVARRIYVDQASTGGFTSFYVGGRQVTVERAMVRNPELRDGGAVNRLDLVLTWPDFRAGGSAIATEQDRVFIALEDATSLKKSPDDIDPAERPIALYAKFLEQEAAPHPSGLVMRRFKSGTPYEGEELYVTTPDERQFSARCPTATAVGAGSQELCLWQLRANDLEIHVRFLPRALSQWEALNKGVRAVVSRIGASAAR